MTLLNVGAHVSLGRDPSVTVDEVRRTGLDSLQIFASSPGAWKPPIVDPDRAARFREARRARMIEPLFIHSIYLINLASEFEELAQRSRRSLIATLKAGLVLGAQGVITHIGSHKGRGFESVAAQVSEGLRSILAEVPEGIDLILENSTGAGGLLGAELPELGSLIVLSGSSSRLKVALDTAHLCGAGWELANATEVAHLLDDLTAQVGIERLALIHANDSLTPCGSHRDRHANIGRGYVGLEGFRNLLALEAFRAVPWIMETPNLERRAEDAAVLRALAVPSLDITFRREEPVISASIDSMSVQSPLS
jgi:deoxyribonuclease IV